MAFFSIFSAFRISSIALRQIGLDPGQCDTDMVADRHHNIVSGFGTRAVQRVPQGSARRYPRLHFAGQRPF
jgi:hypothetical protein